MADTAVGPVLLLLTGFIDSLLIVTATYSALYAPLEKVLTNGKAAIFAVRRRVYSVLPREQRPTSSPLALAALSLSLLIALALLPFSQASLQKMLSRQVIALARGRALRADAAAVARGW